MVLVTSQSRNKWACEEGNSLHCSLLLLKSQTPRNHNKTITQQHCLHGDRERQQLSESLNICADQPGDRTTCLTCSGPFIPTKRNTQRYESCQLATCPCKCFYSGRHYYSHPGAFWKHIPPKQQKR